MTEATLTLTDFLLARLAEDEAVAGATRDSHDPLDWTNYTEAPAVGLEGPVDGPSGYSSLVIDPARVLAEVEAKRRIVDLHTPDRSWISRGLNCATCIDDMAHPNPAEWMPVPSPCPTLRHLASVYADHPDYREEWRA